MPSWGDLLKELGGIAPQSRGDWFDTKIAEWLKRVSKLRSNRNVIFYASAFLQKPQLGSAHTSLFPDEINGYMAVMHGMDWDRGLTLILHTPGGLPTAAETIVEYLHTKFAEIEAIVPTYAMSAGTMMALGCDKVIMGRQSQLGPIDPQMQVANSRTVSARSVEDQFLEAKEAIGGTNEQPGDTNLAHLYAPILQTMGPGLIQEARNALSYSEGMVRRWLEKRMCSGFESPADKAKEIAEHFNSAARDKNHGRRIDRDEARSIGVKIESLEDQADLQEAVLTAYHLVTLLFEQTPSTRVLLTDTGNRWMKNFQEKKQIQIPIPIPQPIQPDTK